MQAGLALIPVTSIGADANGTTFHGKQGERIKQTADKKGPEFIESTKGRFPANLILDDEAAKLVDEQSGTTTSPATTVCGPTN